MALRSFGVPRDAEYRWLRAFCAASASLFTATSGDGRSGFPNPRSMTSRPLRREAALRSLMVANTYGGNPLMRRNSIGEVYDPGRAPPDPGLSRDGAPLRPVPPRPRASRRRPTWRLPRAGHGP